jgi:hypothetical protein
MISVHAIIDHMYPYHSNYDTKKSLRGDTAWTYLPLITGFTYEMLFFYERKSWQEDLSNYLLQKITQDSLLTFAQEVYSCTVVFKCMYVPIQNVLPAVIVKHKPCAPGC